MFTLSNFYKSNQWRDLVNLLKLERVNKDDYVVCERCGKPILKPYDCIAHHKIELTNDNVNDVNISLNPDNIELIHFKCHNKDHKRFGYENQRKVYIVYGAPYAGKSEWVRSVASYEDLIVDINDIYQMISVNERYDNVQRLKANVFGVRDCLIDMIATRRGKWKDAYIIGGYPLFMERKRLADKLGAELIFIDTDELECINNLHDIDKNVTQGCEYIKEWFSRYQPDQ